MPTRIRAFDPSVPSLPIYTFEDKSRLTTKQLFEPDREGEARPLPLGLLDAKSWYVPHCHRLLDLGERIKFADAFCLWAAELLAGYDYVAQVVANAEQHRTHPLDEAQRAEAQRLAFDERRCCDEIADALGIPLRRAVAAVYGARGRCSISLTSTNAIPLVERALLDGVLAHTSSRALARKHQVSDKLPMMIARRRGVPIPTDVDRYYYMRHKGIATKTKGTVAA